MNIRAEKYSAGIMSESSWFLEFRKLVYLRHDGVELSEIRRRCLEENLLGMATERRIISTYQYLTRRIDSMDEQLIYLFCSSDLATQKVINFIAVVQGDRLFFEFLNEVYREKCILGFDKIEASDVNTFFRDKALSSDELASWKETTFSKVRGCFLNFMADANLLRKEKTIYIITPPILDIALERYMRYNGKEHILKAITGVR